MLVSRLIWPLLALSSPALSRGIDRRAVNETDLAEPATSATLAEETVAPAATEGDGESADVAAPSPTDGASIVGLSGEGSYCPRKTVTCYVTVTEVSTKYCTVTETTTTTDWCTTTTTTTDWCTTTTTEWSTSVSLSESTSTTTTTTTEFNTTTLVEWSTTVSVSETTTTTTEWSTEWSTEYVSTTTTEWSTEFSEVTESTEVTRWSTSTIPGEDVTVTLPGQNTTITVTGDDITITVTESGSTTTTTEDAVTVTASGSTITITEDAVTVTLPAETVTVSTTSTESVEVIETVFLSTTVIDSTTLVSEITTSLTETIENTIEETVSVPTTVSETVQTTVPTTISVETTVEVTVISVSIQPPVTTTITEDGTTLTQTLPASTITVTSVNVIVTTVAITETLPPITQTLPPVTETLPGSTETITTTGVITEVVTCPAPTPTLGSTYDPKSNLTWGCKPGWVCNPLKPGDCNIWADSPVDEYSCHPSDCIVSPLWEPVNWAENETSYYPPTEGVFNLAPIAFGLSYDIFELDVMVQKVGKHSYTTISTGLWESVSTLTSFDNSMLSGSVATANTDDPVPTSSYYEHGGKSRLQRAAAERDLNMLFKRGGQTLPAVCFDICNNCYLEAQTVGKIPSLCDADSSFMQYYTGCQKCVDTNEDADKEGVVKREYLEPKFAQWTTYCDLLDAVTGGSSGDGEPQTAVEETTTTTAQTEAPQETVNTSASGEGDTTTTAEAETTPTSATSPTGGEAGSETGATATSEEASPTSAGGSGEGTATSEINVTSTAAVGGSSTSEGAGSGGTSTDEGSSTASEGATPTESDTETSTTPTNPAEVTGNASTRLRGTFGSLFLPLLASLFFA